MVEDLLIATACILKSISQHGEAVIVERARWQMSLLVGCGRQRGHGGRPPSRIKNDGAKGVADDVAEDGGLICVRKKSGFTEKVSPKVPHESSLQDSAKRRRVMDHRPPRH